MYIACKDLKPGEDYILDESYGLKHPFRLLSVEHIDNYMPTKYGKGTPGWVLRVNTLDGEEEFFEADQCYQFGLRIRRVA